MRSCTHHPRYPWCPHRVNGHNAVGVPTRILDAVETFDPVHFAELGELIEAPYETARRAMYRLIAQGHLEKDEDGYLTLGGKL